MRISDLILMSVGNLRRRKLRTILTVLGVLIGTTSVVAMISLGLGMQRAMYSEIDSYGMMTQINIYAASESDDSKEKSEDRYISDEKIKEFSSVDHVKNAAPVLEMQAIIIKGRYQADVPLMAMKPEDMKTLGIKIAWGSFPAGESGPPQLFMGNTVASNMYDTKTGMSPYHEENGKLPVDFTKDSIFMITDVDAYYMTAGDSMEGREIGGEEISDGGEGEEEQPTAPPKKHSVKVTGVMKGDPDEWSLHSSNAFADLDTIKTLLKKEFKGKAIPGQPTTTGGKPLKNFYYTYAVVQADDLESVKPLVKTFRDMGYEAVSEAEWVDQMKSQMRIVQLVLGGIGMISLLVAAIGIANTMMMAIYERTKEIGVMKVIGCSLKNIRRMFLMESAFIGLIGGIVGVVFSFGVSFAINGLTKGMMGDMMGGGESFGISYIPPWLVLVALCVAAFVGVASGYFPAKRAMKLSSLAAIRNE